MTRFNIILDYSHDRIFLEPNTSFGEPFAATFMGGLAIQTEGKDYNTFRIKDVLENSPASEAGLQKEDVIEFVDGKPAADMTLTVLFGMLEKEETHTLNIRRGDKTMDVKLAPRKLL